MKYIYLFSLLLIISCQGQSTNKQSQTTNKFNLDFETYDPLLKFPKNWFEWGDYHLSVDSVDTHSGKFASKITSKISDNSFGSIAYSIPANYEGTSIQLEGYMKIKNVEDGFSGLLLRIDGNNKILAGDNMQSHNIHGTRDWKKYSIKLPYPENAEMIFVAGVLTGKGEAWFDDFTLTIDGKDIQTLKEKEELIFKATLDKEFDLGSNIIFPKVDENLIKKLELLGKVWGFLKYYHPEVGKGNYNWDYELFRILPKYLDTKNKLDRDQYILRWISDYGKINECSKCKETSFNAFLEPDMSWINEFDMNIELKSKLKYIYQNRFQGNHFYISNDTNDNPKFLNENHYYGMSFDDDGVKLLALFRYWNMIHYFFPYKYLTDKKWSEVLKEYIPKFLNSKNKLEYELNFIKLIGDINDTHATTSIGFNNVNSRKGKFYPPFKVQFIENKLVVTDYYNTELKKASRVEVGDIITHINGNSIEYMLDSIRDYYPASNKIVQLRDISEDILRSNKKEVTINYTSKNTKNLYRLPLYEKDSLNMRWYKRTEEKCYKLLDGNIGHVTLETITPDDIIKIKEAFKKTKGIIIDIRNYPSAFVPFSLGSYFISTSTSFAKFTKFNIDNPGEFSYMEAVEIKNDNTPYKGKLVLLVNEITQSQAEYTAMAFRAGDNTTIVGSNTAGADGNVSTIYLPGGLMTRISGIGVYYPNGKETQRVGIIPDIEVKPTIKGIYEGRDELLEKAIDIINVIDK